MTLVKGHDANEGCDAWFVYFYTPNLCRDQFYSWTNSLQGVSMGKSRIERIVRHGIPYLANFRIRPLKIRPTH